jgi:indole-3-glycerol phosphate synthase
MLNQILQVKKQEISELVLPELQNVKRVSFYNQLCQTRNKLGLIAEVKKASPSKGVIREQFHPVEIAKSYEIANADAISVLTDQTFFQGDKRYLTAIKQNVSIPVLRKDFIIDHIQVEESERIGADAILLIGEALDSNKLHDLYLDATKRGLDVLVEVHSEKTLESILNVFTPKILGINNRNLDTFETSIDQTVRMASLVPEESILVSESGIFTYEDVLLLKDQGAKAILVGEALMRQKDIEEAVKSLIGVPSRAAVND